MKKTFLALMISSAAFVGCGGGDSPKSGKSRPIKKTEKTEEKAEKEVASAEKQVVELELGSNDQMQYDKTELRVPANSTVKLTLKHNGKMPKEAMGHNFVLLQKGTDVAAFAMKAIEAGVEKEHIPAGKSVIANTKLIGGGESTTISFDAPAKGTYDYICSFPGHYGIMKGKFIVE